MNLMTQDLQPIKKPSKRMLEIKKLPDGRNHLFMNFSSLAIIQECLRKAQYRLLEKLTNDTDSEAQTFGTAVHKALEHWYSLPEVNRQLTETELKSVDAIVGGLIPEGPYETALNSIHEFIKAGESLRWLGDDDKRSLANGIKILKAYFKHYANDGMEVLRDESGVPYIERACEAKLYEDEKMIISLHGQIDLILKNTITGEIYVSDHKTTAALGKEFYNRISPNHQYTGYIWLAQNLLGLKTDSFLVNGLQVAKTKSEFARQITTRGDDEFAEMRMAYVEASERILRAIEKNQFAQASSGPCSSYGGCPYLDVCQAPVSLRQNIIDGKYKHGTE